MQEYAKIRKVVRMSEKKIMYVVNKLGKSGPSFYVPLPACVREKIDIDKPYKVTLEKIE